MRERTTGLTFISARRLSQREFSEWLDGPEARDGFRYELLNGLVVREPPARWPHGEIGAEIVRRLGSFVRRRRLGRVFDASQGFELPSGDTVEPDVAFVSRETWQGAQIEAGAFLRLVPDLVVEIRSPSTSRRDGTEKKRIYEQNGVREYWIVDPTDRVVTRFDRVAQRYAEPRLFASNDVLESLVVDRFRVAVGEIFPSP